MRRAIAFRACEPILGLDTAIPDMAAIQTPCIKICVLDPQTGCRRTLGEIAAWTSLGDDERARIMAELPGRAGTASRQAADMPMP